jgi:hypothetical protein
MDAQQNRKFYALLNELGLAEQKADICMSVSNGRTEKSSELNEEEVQSVLNMLEEEKAAKVKALRNRLIHRMCLLGYTKDGKPDYQRINYFLKARTGHRNPKKKNLNKLNATELHAVLVQVEAIYKGLIKKLSTDGDTRSH